MSIKTFRHLQNSPLGAFTGLFFVVAVVYGSTLRYPFHFDDGLFVLQSPMNAQLMELRRALSTTPPDWHAAQIYWQQAHQGLFQKLPNRDLPKITLGLNYMIGGATRPEGYHLVNWLLHALNACLVFWVLRLLCRKAGWGLAWLMAAGFALHPLHTSAVTYLWQRNGLMATTFVLLAFGAYVRFRQALLAKEQRRWLALSAFSFFVALNCKEMALTFPLLCWAYEATQSAYHPQHWRGFWRWTLGFGLAFAVLGWGALHQLNFWSHTSNTVGFGAEDLHTPLQHLGTSTRVFVNYWRLLFLPWPDVMNVDHDFPISRSVDDPALWLCGLVHLVIITGAFLALKRGAWLLALGVAWFYLSLAPYFVVPEQDVMVEYKLYLPSLGWVFILMQVLMALQRWGQGIREVPHIPKLLKFGALGGLMIWGLATHERNQIFATQITLWEDTIQKSPMKPRVLHNLGVAYYQEGQIAQAIQAFHQVLLVAPQHFLAQKNLASAYAQQKNWVEAERWYLHLLALQPMMMEAHAGLGEVYLNAGEPAEALQHFQTALRINPKITRLYWYLGQAHAQLGNWPEALWCLTLYLQYDPNHRPARALLEEAKAQRALQKAGMQ